MNANVIKRVAVFLLLWAALDLFVPGFCQTDGIDFPSAPAHPSLISRNASSNRVANPALAEDDCFCCCSHIVHSPHFILEVASATTFAHFPKPSSEPLQIAALHFRPPRA